MKLSMSSPASTNPKWVASAKKQQKLPFLTLSTAKHWQKNQGSTVGILERMLCSQNNKCIKTCLPKFSPKSSLAATLSA